MTAERRRAAKPRVKRISVTLDAPTWEALRVRARAHRVSQAAFVRAAIVGARPGGGLGGVAAPADAWWDALPPERRASIHRWVAAKSVGADVDPDHPTLDWQEPA